MVSPMASHLMMQSFALYNSRNFMQISGTSQTNMEEGMSEIVVSYQSVKLWDVAGYWTGNKREANKSTIKASYQMFMQNFKDKVVFRESARDLGDRMHNRLSEITLEFNSLTPKTLLHGDYKISNIVINKT